MIPLTLNHSQYSRQEKERISSIRRLDGTRGHAGIHYRHLTLVERANTNLIYKEVMEVPPSGRA